MYVVICIGDKLIMNFGAGRDVFDDMDDAEKTGGFGAKVHIRIQQRNGRKSIW